MPYAPPAHRSASIRAALAALEGARRVVLTTHLNADGDGAGSEVALASTLRARGADAWIVNPTPFPDVYRFLLPDPAWVLPAASEDAERACQQADLAVVVDTGEKSRVGRVKPLIDPLPRLIIDHHPPGRDPLDGTELRDPSASATGELVFDLFVEAKLPWSRTVVDGLYVALLTDTGSFRHSNTTARCHRIAAELVDRGADPEELYRRVYGSVPERKLLLLRDCLGTLDRTGDGTVAWMTVPSDSYDRLKATPDDLDGLVDHPRAIVGVEVALLFRTIQGGATKVSFRSNGAVDVNALARAFDGGGHVRASGAVVKGPLDRVRTRVVQAVHDEVRRLGLVPGGDDPPDSRE